MRIFKSSLYGIYIFLLYQNQQCKNCVINNDNLGTEPQNISQFMKYITRNSATNTDYKKSNNEQLKLNTATEVGFNSRIHLESNVFDPYLHLK